jgi:hypothetical protein
LVNIPFLGAEYASWPSVFDDYAAQTSAYHILGLSGKASATFTAGA